MWSIHTRCWYPKGRLHNVATSPFTAVRPVDRSGNHRGLRSVPAGSGAWWTRWMASISEAAPITESAKRSVPRKSPFPTSPGCEPNTSKLFSEASAPWKVSLRSGRFQERESPWLPPLIPSPSWVSQQFPGSGASCGSSSAGRSGRGRLSRRPNRNRRLTV